MERYYALKAANEYTTEQIERKSLMLPGVEVPVTARWSGELLRDTGFGHAERFCCWCNFAGWIRIRD